jgi:hypothetical protein
VCPDDHPTRHQLSPPHKEAVLTSAARDDTPMSAFHPLSNHPETPARDMALGTHQPTGPAAARGSLERR